MYVGIVNSNPQYTAMFTEQGHVVMEFNSIRRLTELKEVDVLCFTGGADVTPWMYGGVDAGVSFTDTERDKVDLEYCQEAERHGLPMVGICRGAQFLTVMSGGKLIQHVNNHGLYGTHRATVVNPSLALTYDSPDAMFQVQVTSTHHQMMFPFNLDKKDYKLLAWAAPRLTNKEALKGVPCGFDDTSVDVEAVYYKNINSLAVQWHPEFPGDEVKECRDAFFKLFNYYLVE